jgi:osmotically-inducible protein OsmY
LIGRSRRHRREPDRVPMEKFNSDSPRHLGGRLLSCACPNHPKLPIRSPACRQHHLHCRRCKTLGRFRPAFLAGSAKPPKMDKQQAVGGIMIGLKSALCLAILMLPLALGGCAGVLLVGGLVGVAGGYVAAQERGVGGAVSDLQIETTIESAFAAADPGLKDGITTTVYQGRVLLTGTVPTPQVKTRAVEVASRVSGIKTLYDDIEVAPSRAAWDATNDAWITARIRTELMLDPDIRSGNYTIDTQKGSVYLIGSARSQAELERATRTARYIPGVKRVITYVELRPGAPVAQQPTPSVVPARSSAGSQSPQGS